MRVPFENWLDMTSASGDVIDVFRESVVCFKAGAYRGALLLSYVGFGRMMRDRLLVAPCPNGLTAQHWSGIIAAIKDDDKWDAQVFTCTQQKAPAPIFDVSDDLRGQLKYWKDRRNDCAHSKNNVIGAPHVEAFWLFLQSNAAKFVPNGSRADLLARIQRHYDPNVTAPGSDPSGIVAMIESAVEHAELPAFFKDVDDQFKSGMFAMRQPAALWFYEAVLQSQRPGACAALAAMLVGDGQLLAQLVGYFPHRVYLAAGPSVRPLWREWLWKEPHPVVAPFAALLRQALIPLPEISEAMAWFVERSTEIPSGDDINVLCNNGYFNAFTKKCFEDGKVNDFAWNSRANLVQWFVQTFPLSDIAVTKISAVFSSQPYPNHICAGLDALFAANAAKREEFKGRAAALHLNLPAGIPSLTQ